MKGLIHTCTIRGRHQNFTLAYDTGAAVFTTGKTLTGATSHATAVIVSTGSIASGSLQVHSVVGTFQDNEIIIDNSIVPGSAKVNGTIAEAFDINGELIYSDIDTTTACRFYSRKGTINVSGQAISIISTNRVMMPATATPAMGDSIITATVGFEGTWTAGSPEPRQGPGGVLGHWECDIAKAGA